ncbi:YrhB domain-containing protein [Kitasatospora sp. NBC_01287]|uniref:YrhB domain-containing protein n=1 Tax=Kitasatospora sp. NBC_01287 TaxID=2903573 RepID=UPI00224E2028|nr:YrhB domain-containing protein [Kitasatospora sp. NBC_01287]MCX4747434.1 YrhB domain-containing protein [Kitasatospora sp. NBC_01287]
MPTSPMDPTRRAAEWVHRTYGPLVQLAVPHPVAQTPQAWLFSLCAVPQPGYPETAMLNASVVVPKDGAVPFHPANADPWGDVAALAQDPGPRSPEDWTRRVNARGCVVSVDAAVNGAAATALPWRSAHEAPGWWGRLVHRHFVGDTGTPQVATLPDWDAVLESVRAGGAGTRGVVWLRREAGGQEATGHLLYLLNDGQRVVALDGQTGGLARLETDGVRSLTLARFQRPVPGERPPRPDWQQPAQELSAAVRKATAWLEHTYDGEVVLTGPTAADDLGRGWLFACNTSAFLRSGDWRQGMLDAALVVPKDDGIPFGLPNSDPWTWLERWRLGGEPGEDGLDLLPLPGPAAWLEPTMARLGPVLETSEYRGWHQAITALAATPDGTRALIWVRRQDARGRESVGLLVNAAQTGTGLLLIDPTRNAPATLELAGVLALHLIRYR